MSKHVRLDGKGTHENDPLRGIWYSAQCSYWTDDWDALSLIDGRIPCCPDCKSVGMQTTARDWFQGAEIFQAQGNPEYVEWINKIKGSCIGRGVSITFLWNQRKEYKKENK